MRTLLQLIQNKSSHINLASNDMQGSPAWNKLKQLIKLYYKNNEITEISFKDAENLFHLNKELNRKMLIEINLELFTK